LIRDGDLFHVSERPDGIHWDAMEYFHPRTRRVVVYAFRGSTSTEFAHDFPLQGLDQNSRYRLKFHDHSSIDQIANRRQLMTKGLHVNLAGPNSSEIIFLEQLPSGRRERATK